MIANEIFIVTLIVTFVVTIFLVKKIIPIMKEKRIGQKILEIGPKWHKEKEGTPTMGGIGFVIASFIGLLVCLLFFGKKLENREIISIVNVFVYGFLNGLIGLIDDIAKVRKRKNEGLTPKAKLILQGICAILFLISMRICVNITTTVVIPFTEIEIELGFLFYVFSLLLLCGIVNAVNLTDGIDGLASTCVLTVGIMLSSVGLVKNEDTLLSFFGAMLIGASIGFLVFNIHPAKIFMGDTGSLFFGGIVVGVAFAVNNPILVIIYGFVFICEALSDILQVAHFKITKGKRLFKMAPLHHHLEKCGFSEMKIVSTFGILSTIFCVIAFLAWR